MKKGDTGLTLLRYPGGKFYARKLIMPFINYIEHDEYREPFFGGGSIFWSKEKSEYNWINDLEPDLYNLLITIQDDALREELLSKFTEPEATKEVYEVVKNMIAKTQLEKAYKYFYLNRTSFSGKMRAPSWGYRPKRSVPPCRWNEKIVPCGEKLKDVKITNLDYESLLFEQPKGKSVMIFVDPPYYKVKPDCHYRCAFTIDDHKRLAADLRKTKFNFVLTYDDCPEVRALYSWAHIYELKFVYRLDNSTNNDNKRQIGCELVITNFKVDFVDE